MARKTSINPEYLRVVPPALEQTFIEQNSPENHALRTEHNPGAQWSVKTTVHGMTSTRACRRHNGPCRKHTRTDEFSSLQKRQWTLPKNAWTDEYSSLQKKTEDLIENTHGLKHTRSTLSKTRACRTQKL